MGTKREDGPHKSKENGVRYVFGKSIDAPFPARVIFYEMGSNIGQGYGEVTVSTASDKSRICHVTNCFMSG